MIWNDQGKRRGTEYNLEVEIRCTWEGKRNARKDWKRLGTFPTIIKAQEAFERSDYADYCRARILTAPKQTWTNWK